MADDQREEGRAGVLGGLDTSIIIPWIKEHYGGAEIIAYCGDVGPGRRPRGGAHARRSPPGPRKCVVEDLREEFVRDYAFKALAAGAVYEDNYLLGTALARPLLAYRQVQVALARGADALAHGATGKGNDQVRFEVTYAAFAPHLTVIAPWREWDIRSREDALAYAAAHDVPVDQTPARHLQPRRQPLAPLARGRQPRGPLGRAAQRRCSSSRVDPEDAPDKPEEVTIAFERGVPGLARRPRRSGRWSMVETLNRIAGAHGVGRLDLVENRLVGHQVARRLRDARGHRALPSPTASWSGWCSTATPALQAVGLRALRAAHLRRAVVLDPARGPGRLRGLHRAGGDGRGARAALQGTGRGRRTPLAAQPLPPGPGHLRRGHGLRPRGRGGLHPALRPARARARADARPHATGVKAVEADGRQRRSGRGRTRALRRDRAPLGFRAAAVAAGIKAGGPDLALLVADRPCTAAGRLHHQPRAGGAGAWSRASTVASGRARAVVVNAGCANAATGEAGLARRARRWRRWPRRPRVPSPRRCVVASTGVIGVPLPMAKLRAGIARAAALDRDARRARAPRHPDHRHAPQGGAWSSSRWAAARAAWAAWPRARA